MLARSEASATAPAQLLRDEAAPLGRCAQLEHTSNDELEVDVEDDVESGGVSNCCTFLLVVC
jgi:hypothetical protein